MVDYGCKKGSSLFSVESELGQAELARQADTAALKQATLLIRSVPLDDPRAQGTSPMKAMISG